MKTSTISKCIFLVMCLLQILGLHSQAVYFNKNVTAGNLNTLLGFQKDLITDLTITGEINGSDIGTIRGMAKLTVLNIADINVVEGGSFSVFGYDTIYVTKNEMPQNMFYGLSNITSVTIPKSVTFIGQYIFYSCKGLTKIYCKALKPLKISPDAFNGMDKINCKLYVPKGTSAAYKSAAYWSEFTKIIEEKLSPISKTKADNTTFFLFKALMLYSLKINLELSGL
ncbi:leucine-rich repeat protein [uncultured Bacteroides sp.]|uniref:leucine-rich repeat protein n=1 Tax=uncultured Bacteroides sp. TaxID=162156 RepID=UPI002AAB2C60|nr:leucine-rich repeat protein [uncultured Bacteroides sp.]